MDYYFYLVFQKCGGVGVRIEGKEGLTKNIGVRIGK